MQQSTLAPAPADSLPPTELVNEIHELQLEVNDLRSLVRDLLSLASLPDHITARARRLIGDGLCAWCLKEQGIAAGEGSHGICHRHKQMMLVDAARRHTAKHRKEH